MNTKSSHPLDGIRERRKSAGVSQQQLAVEAGCSIAYVQLLENGYSPGVSDVLPRIERALENFNTENPDRSEGVT